MIKIEDLIPKVILDFGSSRAMIQMRTSLGPLTGDEAKFDAEIAPIIALRESSEQPINLITSFRKPSKYEIAEPFHDLYSSLVVFCQEQLDDNLLQIYSIHFWRLYACYRYGFPWKWAIEGIDRQNDFGLSMHTKDELVAFWSRELPLLAKKLKPYIFVNRYLIMPTNRLINRFGLAKFFKQKPLTSKASTVIIKR